LKSDYEIVNALIISGLFCAWKERLIRIDYSHHNYKIKTLSNINEIYIFLS